MLPRLSRRRLFLTALPLVSVALMAMTTPSRAAEGLVAVPESLDVGASQGQGAGIVAVENGSSETVVIRVLADRINADGTVEPAPELVAVPAAFELSPWGNRMVLTGVHPSMGGTTTRAYRLRLVDVRNPSVPSAVVAVNWVPTAGATTVALQMEQKLGASSMLAVAAPQPEVAKPVFTTLQVAQDVRVPRNLRPAAYLPAEVRSATTTMMTTNVVVDAVPVR